MSLVASKWLLDLETGSWNVLKLICLFEQCIITYYKHATGYRLVKDASCGDSPTGRISNLNRCLSDTNFSNVLKLGYGDNNV